MRSPNNPIQFAAVRDQRKLRGNHVILTNQFPASGNMFRDDGADFGILDAEFAEALMGIRGTRSLIHKLQYRANSGEPPSRAVRQRTYIRSGLSANEEQQHGRERA